ncbi:MAG: L-threonylcarbamoyladenylate synthase [Bacteroidota bacterium]
MIGNDIEIARNFLMRDQVTAIPTETVYGLAGNALKSEVVARIFEIKNRPHFDPLIVHISDKKEATKYAKEISPLAEKLMEAFWPGPLTILFPKKKNIPDLVTAGLNEVGLRVPNHELTLLLLRTLKFPLAAPSANPFGYISPTQARHVEKQLGDAIPYILDGGPSEVGIESTVIRVVNQSIHVLRAGGITVEMLAEFCPHITRETSSSSAPASPGLVSSHYAPNKPLKVGSIENLLNEYAGVKAGVLSFSKSYDCHKNCILSARAELTEAAKNLFTMLRELDESDCEIVFSECVPNEGLGVAINDKLMRASK